jgi:cellulose biosynthesis protein BcsQ
MIQDVSSGAPCVIVVANEKGGSGKSTVAIHLAVALLRSGQSVATIDLDARQRSLTHYIDNRLAWARQRGRDLPTPTHVCLDGRPMSSVPAKANRRVPPPSCARSRRWRRTTATW